MTPCETCGLPVYRLHQGDDWHGTCHRQDPSDAYPHVIACWQRGYEREKARAEAAEVRARARELDMHEAQGLAWRLRRAIRVFDSAQMSAVFGGAWSGVEMAAAQIRDEWDPWDFGDEPTSEGAANLLTALALDGEPDADEIADARAPDGAAERLRARAAEHVREARRNAKEPKT